MTTPQYAQTQLRPYELVPEERRRRLSLQQPLWFEPSMIEPLYAAQAAYSNFEWERELTAGQSVTSILAVGRDAAAQGVPEAHEYLSTAMLKGHTGIDQDLGAALFHAAIATRIYEALDDEESAAPMRIRRANLARTLPPETVAALWPKIRDWRPLEREW